MTNSLPVEQWLLWQDKEEDVEGSRFGVVRERNRNVSLVWGSHLSEQGPIYFIENCQHDIITIEVALI